jgi:hypothetical protein
MRNYLNLGWIKDRKTRTLKTAKEILQALN